MEVKSDYVGLLNIMFDSWWTHKNTWAKCYLADLSDAVLPEKYMTGISLTGLNSIEKWFESLSSSTQLEVTLNCVFIYNIVPWLTCSLAVLPFV